MTDSSTVVVRLATDDELDAAGECVRAAYAADGMADLAYQAVLANARARADTADVLVALDRHGVLVGSVTFALAGSPWAEVATPGEAEFRMLGVAPAARGRGVARALVMACLERARASRVDRVVLSSQVAMTTAHRLYASVGFLRAPERDWQPYPGLQLLGFSLDL